MQLFLYILSSVKSALPIFILTRFRFLNIAEEYSVTSETTTFIGVVLILPDFKLNGRKTAT